MKKGKRTVHFIYKYPEAGKVTRFKKTSKTLKQLVKINYLENKVALEFDLRSGANHTVWTTRSRVMATSSKRAI